MIAWTRYAYDEASQNTSMGHGGASDIADELLTVDGWSRKKSEVSLGMCSMIHCPCAHGWSHSFGHTGSTKWIGVFKKLYLGWDGRGCYGRSWRGTLGKDVIKARCMHI